MSISNRSPIDIGVLISTVCLVVVLKASQSVFNLGVVATDGLSLTFGFPWVYYSESLLLDRGRMSYLGVTADLVFALTLGCIAGYLTSKIKGLVKESDLD